MYLSLVIFLSLRPAHAVQALHLKGSIKFSDVKAGFVYLMVRPEGGSGLVSPSLESGDGSMKKEVVPTGSNFQGYVPAGTYGGKGDFEFDVAFPKGKYSVSAFVQNGGNAIAKCENADIGGLAVAHNCFPSKGDTVCPSFDVDLMDPKPKVWSCGGATVPGMRPTGKR